MAKTTIYRRYADRQVLLRAALSSVIGDPGEPPGSDPRQKLRWALDQTWQQMAEVLGPGGLAAVVGGADPAFSDVFHQVLSPYTEALISLIRADMAAGDLRQDLDADASVSLLVGPTWGSWFGVAASTTGSPNAAWS